MGKKWDHQVPSVDVWRECLRVLKPGGHMLVACGTRTQHRMVVNIEDAGFEIRDVVTWLYGSGFPKSLDVSKAIDKAAGAAREVLGVRSYADGHIQRSSDDKLAPPIGTFVRSQDDRLATAPSTDAAKQWQGWGTALKPACEFWTLARKPLTGTVAQNVQEHGTGAINVDGCRIGVDGDDPNHRKPSTEWQNANNPIVTNFGSGGRPIQNLNTLGRWPANLILDEVAAEMLGEPSRFFYVAKASKSERGEGNGHPTVKPVRLMRYLCRLITPPGGTVLDPFTGSGSTGVGAAAEGFAFIGIEREAEYVAIATARVTQRA